MAVPEQRQICTCIREWLGRAIIDSEGFLLSVGVDQILLSLLEGRSAERWIVCVHPQSPFLTTPGYDTEAARYIARLLGVRQVVLGVMLWQARNDRAWLRRVATLNVLTEVLDAAATLASVSKRRDGRPSAAPAVAALATSAAFLALRAAS